jgi:hypothetical protein
VLKVDLRAASTVINQLSPLGVEMSIDWSTGVITVFLSENKDVDMRLQEYLNLKLSPEEFFMVAPKISWPCAYCPELAR